MRNLFFIFISSLCLSGILFANDLHLLPANNFMKGFSKAGQPKIFTSSDLYGYIDGGAELFLEFGFEQLTLQRYKNSNDDEITFEIYRLTDQVAAAGIYFMKCGKPTPDISFSERHTVNKYHLMLQKNNYFIIIANQDGNEKYLPSIIMAAKDIASKISSTEGMNTQDGTIKILDCLPVQNRLENTIRFIRGPYALQSLYTLGDGNILQLNNTITAVTADYKDQNGNAFTRLIVEYPDTVYSITTFQFIKTHLDRYLMIRHEDDDSFVFEDQKKMYGSVSLNKKQIEIKLNLVSLPSMQ